MSKRNKSILAWGGFIDGKLCNMQSMDGYLVPGFIFEIFTSRRAARCRYQDVRRIRITEVRK